MPPMPSIAAHPARPLVRPRREHRNASSRGAGGGAVRRLVRAEHRGVDRRHDSNLPGTTPTPDQRVYAENFPDPHVIADGDTFYAYTTNGDAGNMPVIRSTDLHTWEAPAMPCRSWPRGSSPEGRGRLGVIAVDDTFIAYYTAAQLGTGLQCIGRPSPTIRRVPSSMTPTPPSSVRTTRAVDRRQPVSRRRRFAVPVLEERRQLLRARHVALRPATQRRRPVADRRADPPPRPRRRLGGQRHRSALHVAPRRPAVPVLFRQRLRLGGLCRRLRHVCRAARTLREGRRESDPQQLAGRRGSRSQQRRRVRTGARGSSTTPGPPASSLPPMCARCGSPKSLRMTPRCRRTTVIDDGLIPRQATPGMWHLCRGCPLRLVCPWTPLPAAHGVRW